MDSNMSMRASVKVQSGSIGCEPKYIWITVEVFKKIDNYQYVARGVDGNDQLYYLKPEEIHCSLYDFKLYFDERF